MKTSIINNINVFYKLEEDWRNLCRKIDNYEIFYSWEWICTFIKSMELSNINPYVLITEDKDNIISILPLCLEIRKIGIKKVKVLRFIVNRTVDYYNFLIDKDYNKYDVIKSLINELYKLSDWDLIELQNLNTRHRETLMINEVLKLFKGLKCIKEINVITPYLYYNEMIIKMNSKQIKDIQRREKKLQRENEVKYCLNVKWDREVWNALIKLHKLRWSQSVFIKKEYIEFYESLIPYLEETKQLEFSYATINNEIAAIHFGFKCKEKVYYYIPIYLNKYSSTGIGAIFLYKIIEHYKDNYIIFDFLRGDEIYKFDWTDLATENLNYYIVKQNNKYLKVYLKFMLKMKENKFVRNIYNKIRKRN
ncbi:GNAT family N-acetyltransferase [Candidatus Clostridium stratigraminis]|uniref:GNAT family N-acetyltransferase n=1 Tax=Candidatus Clostridium stratigraminis TaxID=3381661 RepID=A0ABW8T0Z5_9CLOT